MKKKLIALGIVALSTMQLNAQTYTLSKGVTVGCANANPITDVSKKIDLAIDGSNATFTLSSLNCQKQYKGTALKLENEAKAYIDTKENKAVIITKDDRIALVVQNSGNYEVVVGGHLDKKSAKLVNTEDLNAELKASLSKFPSLLEEAKKEAERAEMQAKMLPIPSGDYSDKYGVGGLYYFSEPVKIEGDKYVSAVQLEFSIEKREVYAHYAEGKKWLIRIFDGDISKALKEEKASTVPSFEFDFIYGSDLISRKRMYLVENGLYYVESFGYANSSTDCSNPKYWPAEDGKGGRYSKIFFIGKDKARVEELANDFETAKQAVMTAFVSNCEYSKSLYAKNNPMPTPGMNDVNLQKEVTRATKLYTDAHWSQTVEYVYIKSSDWIINRNKVSGVIVSRSLTCVAVMKTKSGACQWEEVVLRENYDGANYGPVYYYGNSQRIYPVDCTESNKYKK